MPNPKQASHGGALLTALFIMTLVAIVATAMSTRLQVDIYRTRLILLHDKLYLAAQGVSLWAMSELNKEKNRFTKSTPQGMVGKFPDSLSTIYPSVKLSGELYDLQSRFNLNNLLNKKYLLGFVNMVGHTSAQISTPERVNIAMALNYWLSPFDLSIGKDAYLSYYLKLKPPYHPSHQLMASSSELRLIQGVTAAIFMALEPYITALPDETAININTASKPVLMSFNIAMTEDKANEIITARGENGIQKLEKIGELIKKLNLLNEQITLDSTYFLSIAHASSDNFNFTVYTVLKRERDKKGKIAVSILRQSFNVF